MGEHVRLAHPTLDVDVRGHVAELDLVAAGREEHPDGQVRHRLERGRVHLRRWREGRRDAAEADVDERALIARPAAGPPVGQRLAARVGGRMAEAQSLVRRRIDRTGPAREVRRLRHALREPGPTLVEHRPRDRERVLLHGRGAHCYAGVRDTVLLGRRGGGVLRRLADDEIGAPLLDRVDERREHGVDVEAGEDDADDDGVALTGRERRHPAPDGTQDLVRRRRALPERVPARLERRRADDQHVTAGSCGGIDERDQRSEVSRALGRGEQDPHRLNLSDDSIEGLRARTSLPRGTPPYTSLTNGPPFAHTGCRWSLHARGTRQKGPP